MKKKALFILFFLFCYCLSTTQTEAQGGNISVILASDCTDCIIKGSKMNFADPSGYHFQKSGSFSFSTDTKDLIYIGSLSLNTPIVITSPQPISFKGAKYYGSLIFKVKPTGFDVINVVDIELYLRGVVKAEMSVNWPLEAIKAQTVLARTYAVSSGGKHGEYDVCSSAHCQVYRGITDKDPENTRLNEAIRSTEGVILRWHGSPARVFYHSDSGGMVTSSKNVWGGEVAYLQPRIEPIIYTGPHSTWETTISLNDIESKLSKSGFTVGSIQSISPTKRDDSGRILNLQIKGSAGIKNISGYAFRSAVGTDKIKSTLFEFGTRSSNIPNLNLEKTFTADAPKYDYTMEPLSIDFSELPEDAEEKLVWLTKNQVFTLAELMYMLSKPGNFDAYIKIGIDRAEGRLQLPTSDSNSSDKLDPLKKNITNVKIIPPSLSMTEGRGNSITFYGRGWGHGVGLSQWGAKTLAENGWDYQRILQYYFPGTTTSK